MNSLLVNGNIPAQTPCPFYGHCLSADARCPRQDSLNPHPYSCAAARYHDLMRRSKTSIFD